MARNAELIRQWEILRTVDASADGGVTIARLAQHLGVHQRTVRRHLDALVSAGFPIHEDTVSGSAVWRVDTKRLRGLTDRGFSVSELCALYFSRSLLEVLTQTPFATELEGAFRKMEEILPDRMKRYLDRLPSIVKSTEVRRPKRDERRTREVIGRLLEASLGQHRVAMSYRSFSDRRAKDYKIDPYRLLHSHGGLYLSAYVPASDQMRTFAVDRIRSVSVLEDTFELLRDGGGEPFPHSLRMNSGTPTRVEIEFDPDVADYIRERDWHPSQRVTPWPDGSVRLTLEVCIDTALRSWILSFGPLARVVSPATLAGQILEELDEAQEKYAPRMRFELPVVSFEDLDAQRSLPY
jgi:predicted DNA-binding transcriptional regulator YafY